ncbi:AraC family transcriptional regulator N-terminal domain-containing protein [Paraburkholderia strydomiana]
MNLMIDAYEHARLSLANRIQKWTASGEQYIGPISGLYLYRHVMPNSPMSCMLEPAIAVPVQGTKRTRLGAEVYEYDRSRFLLTSLALPVVMQVSNANPEAPFLSAVLKLDPKIIGEQMIDAQIHVPDRQSIPDSGIVLGRTTTQLLEAVGRLVGLMDEPDLIPVLAPLLQREIFYRLLISPVGKYLWQMASVDSQSRRISRAIEWLKANFREPLQIKDLAHRVDMSPSRLHHHFRQFTSMSPLQFQKWLRLAEARRLMVVQGMAPSIAAYEVGYGSPSQFSREYARMFGTSPRRDVLELTKEVSA